MEKILVLDAGGEYSRLTALKVRENNVFSEILPISCDIESIAAQGYKGIIVSAGKDISPESEIDRRIFESGIPVLGIGMGAVLMARTLGGEIKNEGEVKGSFNYALDMGSSLFAGLSSKLNCFIDTTEHIATAPVDFKITAKSAVCRITAMENTAKRLYGVMFHPELSLAEEGGMVIKNFLFNVCGCHREWVMNSFMHRSVKALREKTEGKRIVCALSGGVKSTVAAMLLHRAAGDALTCIFIDHGMHRLNEAEFVKKFFGEQLGIKVIYVDAKERFAGQLKGIFDSEQKRTVMEKEFARIFEDTAKQLGHISFIVRGSVYTDILDNSEDLTSKLISCGEVIEPLRSLFKDEARRLGTELGLPSEVVLRQSFPKTGLALRISGDITQEKIMRLSAADAFFREEAAKAGVIKKLAGCYAMLSDNADGGYTVTLRAVTSENLMTAEFARLPFDVLSAASKRILSSIPDVCRVVYDVTDTAYTDIES